jgi:uncharacterized protein (TIGR00730 family)
MNSVVVFCGSSEGHDPRYVEAAQELGNLLAEERITLVYGGAKIGIMGHLAKAVLAKEGKAVGIIPEFLLLKEVVHDGLSELIVTQNMHERKLKMHERSEGIIMLPGGFGTLEEFFEMLTWAQLGLHQYPIGILNTGGFYNDLLKMLYQMVEKGFLRKENYEMILVADTAEELLLQMGRYRPLPLPKWMNKKQA